MFKTSIITDQVSMDFEYALQYIKKLGVEYVEIHALWDKNIEELTDEEISKAKDIVKKYNMKVSLISSTIFLQSHLIENDVEFKPLDDYFITIAGNYDFHIQALKKCIRLCEIFETNKLRTFGFMEEEKIAEEKLIGLIKEKLAVPVELTKKAGLELLIENCPHSYLPTGRLSGKLIKEIESDNLFALWDPGNALRAGGRPYPEDYESIKDSVKYVHIKDVNSDKNPQMVPVGEGIIEYDKIFRRLLDDGFTGYISLEPEYVDAVGGRPEGCRKSLQGVRRILEAI